MNGLNGKAEENLHHYRRHWHPKKQAGRFRLLEEPKPVLKAIQRQILHDILGCIAPHLAAHGFRSGHSIATNAAEHCGRAIVIRFDLKDFFPSIPGPRVACVFEGLGYPRRIAEILAGLCTTRLPYHIWNARPGIIDSAGHGTWLRLGMPHLPQGAPTSPALANLCAYRLDCRLSALARGLDAVYTRYADDLTFSGSAELSPPGLQKSVMNICGEEGFAINPRKTRIQRQSTRQNVTGVTVNVRPNIPRSDYDRLKAILANCVRHGPGSQNRDRHADFKSYLAGRIAFIAMIHPVRGRKLWRQFDKIAWNRAE